MKPTRILIRIDYDNGEITQVSAPNATPTQIRAARALMNQLSIEPVRATKKEKRT